jgi:hypothetical protein
MGKRAAIFVYTCLVIVALMVIIIVCNLDKGWLPYVSKSRIPPPVVARLQSTNGSLRVFPNVWGSLILLPDGSLWNWGPIGSGSFSVARVPQQVGTNCDWSEASGSIGQGVARRNDGTWWHWGNDFAAPLFSTTKPSFFIPLPEQLGSDNDWTSLTTTDQHSVGLKKNGTVWAWGHNEEGQIGNGLGANETSRVYIAGAYHHPIQTNLVQVGTNHDWIAISSGFGKNTFGIRSNGTLWVWGVIDYTHSNLPGPTIWVPTQVCRETNWVALERNLAFNRDGQVWQLLSAAPDASAPAAKTCMLLASNCVAGRFAVVMQNAYQVHADGTLWTADLNLRQDRKSEYAQRQSWRRVGKRTDWISLWGFPTAYGLTADGTLWVWGFDMGQDGVMPFSLRIYLLKDKLMTRLGMPPAKPHDAGYTTPFQKTPRPLMRILPPETPPQ